MIVTAWSNGSGSYGLKIAASDRDEFFRREWKTVHLKLEGAPTEIEINVAKPSFWTPICRELIHRGIRSWLQANGLAPWARYNPPKLWLEAISQNRFQLHKPK